MRIFLSLFLALACCSVAVSADKTQSPQYKRSVEIVCPDAKDPAVAPALKALRDTLSDELALSSTVSEKGPVSDSMIRIFAGSACPDSAALLKEANIEKDARPGADAYRIKSFKSGGRDCIIIDTSDKLAISYALFFLSERIMLDCNVLQNADFDRKSVFRYRMAGGTKGNEELLKFGYNVGFVSNGPSLVALWNGFDKDLVPEGSDSWKRIEKARKTMKIQAESLRKMHMLSMSSNDEFLFPAEIKTRPYYKDMLEKNGRPSLCFASKILWDAYSYKYKEFVKDFPEVNGVMMRLGENYSFMCPGYIGNGIYDYHYQHEARSPYCQDCRSISYEDRIAKTINETASILVPSGKIYLHRTWDTSNDLVHGDQKMFQKILSKVKDPEKILWAIKYTKTDFWRYNFPNPCIGIGDVPQLIEFQCQREYEGKGAFPNFLGEEVSLAYRYIKFKGCVGVWNWFHGGGWNGPHIRSDIWNQANIYAVSRLMWNPGEDPAVIAKDWAALTFGKEAAPAMAELLLLSDDAVLKWRYMEPYSRNHFGWTPANLWTRDDVIRGEAQLGPIYNEVRGKVEDIIAEKEESVRHVEKMKALYESVAGKIVSFHKISGLTASEFGKAPLKLRGVYAPRKAGSYKLIFCLYDFKKNGSLLEKTLSDEIKIPSAPARISFSEDNGKSRIDAELVLPAIREGELCHPEIIIKNMETKIGIAGVLPVLIFVAPGGEAPLVKFDMKDDSQALSATVKTSLEYESLLFKTCRDFCGAYFLFRRYLDKHDEADKAKALAFVESWKDNWSKYNSVIEKMPYAATLYKDDGMGAAMGKIETVLKTGRSIVRLEKKVEQGNGPFSPDKNGFIRNWLVCGPFPNPGGRPYYSREKAMKNQKGYDMDFLTEAGGEKGARPSPGASVRTVFPLTSEGYWTIPSEEKVECFWLPRCSSQVELSFKTEFSVLENIAAYAACYVESPADMKVRLKAGSDDGCKIWLDGKYIGGVCTFRDTVPDSESYDVELRKGLNLVLVKVVQDLGGMGFCLRFTDMNDKPLTDLKIWLAPNN